MEKIVQLLIRIYPLEDVPMKRRVIIHSYFWLSWSIILFFSVIPGSSLTYRLWFCITTTLQSAIIYYLLTYFLLERIIKPSQGLFWLVFFYILNWLIFSIFYKTYLFFGIQGSERMNLYIHNYLNLGFYELLEFKSLMFQLFIVFYGTAPAFLMKLGRFLANYASKSFRLESEKKEIELNFLRLQLNPHFLLNTLNNIYSQVISKDEKASSSLITLAELLTYILYEANEEQVSLKKEIRFIRDYIDLEKLRNSQELKITFEVEGNFKHYVIAPLILISFIENAFKHGVGDSTIASYIHIDMLLNNETDELSFRVTNSKPRTTKQAYINQKGGIGIENTEKRLKMLYPNTHNLSITNGERHFEVLLKMALKKVPI